MIKYNVVRTWIVALPAFHRGNSTLSLSELRKNHTDETNAKILI